MAKTIYPTFNIHHLDAPKLKNGLLNADRFKNYLANNPHLQVVHKHTFYHLLFFTKGGGEHQVDFKKFQVQKGMIYFMRPGQVHNWNFKGAVDGYIINFSATFFDSLFINAGFVDQFAFFDGTLTNQVLVLKKATQKKAVDIFEEIIREQQEHKPNAQLMIAALMMQLFVTISREIPVTYIRNAPANHNVAVAKKFQTLVEENFRQLKLPKAYASLLHITPHQLNALSNEYLYGSAGEVIRNRIVLEAKRLLVNFELSIANIALELDFPDASYFVKFFKKYTGSTPEAFRSKHYTQ
ncbi:MAG: helix-turn-helix transcriptional regulator [Agriterribacter sp.]